MLSKSLRPYTLQLILLITFTICSWQVRFMVLILCLYLSYIQKYTFRVRCNYPLRVSVMCGHVGVVNTVHTAISDLCTTSSDLCLMCQWKRCFNRFRDKVRVLFVNCADHVCGGNSSFRYLELTYSLP
jgi:hypothetical protein